MKIVINKCYGGYGLSHKAVMRYAKLKGIKLYAWIDDITKEVYGKDAVVGNEKLTHHYATIPIKDEADYKKQGKKADNAYFNPSYDIERTDSILIKVVKELGSKANGRCAKLKIIEIPDGTDWHIEEYDGIETIDEKHESWS